MWTKSDFPSMNQTIQELMNRKSVRVYTEEPISQERKELILHAAMQAPTAGNQQLYTIIDVQDSAKKERLADLCDHQPFIAKAPLVLVFVADYQKWYDAFVASGCEPRDPGAGDLMISVTDAVIAAQNAVVAAESMGIGSCYIGDIMENNEDMRSLLKLPQYTFPCALVVFGYPTEQQKQRMKPERHRLSDIVYTDEYHQKDAQELKAMYESKAKNQPYEEWMKAFCNRKYNADYSKERKRSVRKYIRQFDEEI